MKYSKTEWKTFDTLYALSSFANYWSENEKLIQKAAQEEEKANRPKWTPHDEETRAEYQMEVRHARALHDEVMAPMFRYSCIVMLYTNIERELRRLVTNLEKDRGEQRLKVNDIRGSYLTQVTKFTEVCFTLQLKQCPQYEALCDMQKIRDCIVHCRGEVCLFNEKDRKHLLLMKDSRAGFFAWERTDIEVHAECIEQFIRETWSFFMWVFGQLKWEVDDGWKSSEWASPKSP